MAGEYGPQGVGKPAAWCAPKNVKNRGGKWGLRTNNGSSENSINVDWSLSHFFHWSLYPFSALRDFLSHFSRPESRVRPGITGAWNNRDIMVYLRCLVCK